MQFDATLFNRGGYIFTSERFSLSAPQQRIYLISANETKVNKGPFVALFPFFSPETQF